MDFWSRLIGGVKAGKGKSANGSDPQQRLARFKRSYSHALQIWHKTDASTPDALAVETIQTSFRRMTALLQDDSRAPAPHLCISFAASSYVYTAVARIAVSLNNEAIINETTTFFGTLVDSDEEDLLGTERFARALTTFVDQTIGSGAFVVGQETEAEILELIFGIAAKIRLEPDLLPVWFQQQSRDADAEHPDDDAEVASKRKDFPLCHLFAGHVYSEGRAGDFARTGLLYIFEAASHSLDLEAWITDSELPTLLATGLGALYSQLGRKLTIAHPDEGLPLILALSDNKHVASSSQVESFYSGSLQSQLSTFMSYMVFWQDLLEHCQSAQIKQTLIDHFQIFFLQQILYPSLLESSDIDGGSSVAVLTYIWRILDSVDHPDIIHLILSYLLALPDPNVPGAISTLTPTTEKGRESPLDTANAEGNAATLSPTFFNLVDLILTSVQSHNPETVTAAMRLVTTILNKHHRYAVSNLVKTIRVSTSEPLRTTGSLRCDLDELVSLALEVGGPENMDEAYDNSLKDAMSLIEGHGCTAKRLHVNAGKARPGFGLKRRSSVLPHDRAEMFPHYLIVDDPLLRALSVLLRTFFTNDIETNLGLTNVIVHLASCPYMHLEGWLIPNASKLETGRVPSPLPSAPEGEANAADDPDAMENARVSAFKQKLRRPTGHEQTSTPIGAALRYLSAELSRVKLPIPEFDYLVASRKRAFQGALEIEAENELRIATPGASTPTRRSLDLTSSDAASPRASARQSPAPPIKRISPAAPESAGASHNRGRSIASIVGGQRKNGAAASPQRPSPLMSPSLRANDANSRRSSRSPTKGAPRALSPLKVSSFPPRDAGAEESADGPPSPSIAASMETEIFERKVKFPAEESGAAEPGSEDVGGATEPSAGNSAGSAVREASLTHVLTNVVILQEFILELAAIIQVRASLLDGEVTFV